MNNVKFIVLEQGSPYPTFLEPTIFLLPDSWNDWWEYRTLFGVFFI